ncbi:unnamed protein product [Kuraishia capsulata CBS 1993]|uniref:Fumarylacetoacetase-like C-terminal domain-containing protein n=1 Tax=Kuraishia capsulata CBS 1993 TaxID=1382522 RepID=W6MJU5_9ASCO|nr:uncharacterized protein KUCA_T00002234001 [Kuraishia capsulata CBS 1993]CDK26263.1 unnamed protein product [Kuraishia capsulata CBS 1993]
MVAWKRLIRFVAEDGKIYQGQPIGSPSEDIGKLFSEGAKIQANVITGDIFHDAIVTEQILEVKKLLGPLTPAQVPLLKCVGLNYMKHIREANRTPPPYPSIFFKAGTAVADHGEPIPVPKIAQDGQLDYEGELCVVIGKTGKDIKKEDALDYVLGYTAGNDVSARFWQRKPEFAGRVPQWNFSKGFDKWAPLGPVLVSSEVITSPGKLDLKTLVNGEIRQHTNTDDLIFDIPAIIAFISQGTTLQAGTVIMSGTPGGVGIAASGTPRPLNDGDVVEITIEEIGTLSNKMQFV